MWGNGFTPFCFTFQYFIMCWSTVKFKPIPKLPILGNLIFKFKAKCQRPGINEEVLSGTGDCMVRWISNMRLGRFSMNNETIFKTGKAKCCRKSVKIWGFSVIYSSPLIRVNEKVKEPACSAITRCTINKRQKQFTVLNFCVEGKL